MSIFSRLLGNSATACLAFVSFAVVSTPLAAHHSTSFYGDEVVEIEGELAGLKWRNPHVTWQLKIINEAGEEELWNLEGASTYPLKRAGVTRDLFIIGDHIKVAGNMSLKEKQVFLAKNMLLSDGRELLLWGNIAAQIQPRNLPPSSAAIAVNEVRASART